MDTILQAFLSWQFLAFALAVGAIVFVIRQLVEYGMSNWWPLKQWNAANKEAKLWRGLILPILPIFLGAGAALLFKQYPYPEGFAATSGRFVFGLVGGFTSGMFVRLYKSFLASKASEFANAITSKLKPRGSQNDSDTNSESGDDVSSKDVPKRGRL